MKAITGGIGWEKAESQGPREAGPPFGEPGAGKFSGAGSLESRPRRQEKEVKTGKWALKVKIGAQAKRKPIESQGRDLSDPGPSAKGARGSPRRAFGAWGFPLERTKKP